MSNLQLSLKKQWFDLTKSGVKTEDYREITGYWCNRFLLINNEPVSKHYYPEHLAGYLNRKSAIQGILTFKPFSHNIMTLGYPKSTDSDRILKLEHKGIEIRTGNHEWGAEPNKLYFVIMHGSFLQ